MFTGIIETTGKLEKKTEKGHIVRFRFAVSGIQEDMKLGDSLAANGVCLTVVDFGPDFVEVDAINATMKVTALKYLKRGYVINFERSLKLGDRLGGHWVQGHVDGVGKVVSRIKKGKNIEFRIEAAREIIDQLVPKGSVAVNGISLTVQKLDTHSFTAAIIPHTLRETNMRHLEKGCPVNLEADILSKYVRRAIGGINGRKKK